MAIDDAKDSLLRVEGLSVAYGEEASLVAVDNVSFTLNRGEILAVVGESGCGKSTLAMAIPRLLPEPPAHVKASSVSLCGIELAGARREELQSLRGKRIGVIFQDPMTSLSPLHRIGSQLEEALLLHNKMSPKEMRAKSLYWLERVGINDPLRLYDAYPHELSGGMQQRVMIAMALINDPDVVIADEPTTALDATTQLQVLELMRNLVSKQSGMLLITHDMGVVRQMATRVIVMYAGRIIEEATKEDLFANPLHPYTRALLASMPTLKTRGRRLPVIEGTVPSLRESSVIEGCRFKPRCLSRQECAGFDEYAVVKDKSGDHFCRCKFTTRESC